MEVDIEYSYTRPAVSSHRPPFIVAATCLKSEILLKYSQATKLILDSVLG